MGIATLTPGNSLNERISAIVEMHKLMWPGCEPLLLEALTTGKVGSQTLKQLSADVPSLKH